MFNIADVFVQIGVQGLSAVTSALNQVKGYLASLGQTAGAAISNLAGTGGVIGNVAKAFQGVMQFGSGISAMFQGLGSALASTIPLAFALGQAFYNVSNVLLGALPEKLISGMMAMATVIKNAFVAQFSNLGSLLSAKLSQLGSVIASHLGPIKAQLQQLATGMQAIISQALSALGIKFGQLVPKVKAAWNVIKSAAASTAQAVYQAFSTQLGNLGAWISSALAPIGAKLGPLFAVIKSNAQFAFTAIKTQIAQALTNLPQIIQGAVQAFQGLKNAISGVGSAFAAALGPVATKAFAAMQSAASGVYSGLVKIKNGAVMVGSAVQAMYANFVPIFGAFFNFMRSGISSIVGLARSMVSALMTPLRMLKNFIFSTQGMITALVGTLSAAAVGRYIVDVTTDAEDAAVSFRVMLGSAEKAVEMLRQIQYLADHTPLQLPEVRQGARGLLAMGVAGNEVVDRLRRIGDVAQGIQVPFNDLVAIYGKIYQKNRMTGDEIRQFGRRGIPMVRLLSEQLKVSTEEIYKMAAEGKLHFKDFDAAFQSMTEKGGMFYNMLLERSRTITGRWSTLKDSVRAVATQIGQALTPAIKQALEYFIKFADWAKVAIKPYKTEIEAMANYLVARIPPLINTIKAALPAVMDAAKTAFAVVKAIHGVTDTIIAQVSQMVGGAGGLAQAFMRVSQEIRFAVSQWRLFVRHIQAYSSNLWSNLAATASALWNGLKSNVVTFFTEVMPALALGLASVFEQLFKNIVARFKETLTQGLPTTSITKDLDLATNSLMRRMSKAWGKMSGLKGFDFKTIFGLNDPEVKKIWDLFLGRRKVFFFEQAISDKLAGWFEKVKGFFGTSRTDLGAAHAATGAEMAEQSKRGVRIVSLLEFNRGIQQAATARERKRDQWAQQTAEGVNKIAKEGVRVSNLANVAPAAMFA